VKLPHSVRKACRQNGAVADSGGRQRHDQLIAQSLMVAFGEEIRRTPAAKVFVRRVRHGCEDGESPWRRLLALPAGPVAPQAWGSSRPFSVGSFLIAFPVFASASRSSYTL
jgi:hypothetical protein